MELTGATVAGIERRAMVAKGLQKLCERAGVTYHSPHKLLHGHTVYALKRAHDIADMKSISQNLMHASPTVTDQVYRVLSGEDVSSHIERLTHNGQLPAGSVDLDTLIDEFRQFLVPRVRS